MLTKGKNTMPTKTSKHKTSKTSKTSRASVGASAGASPSRGPAMRIAVAQDVLFLLKKGLNATGGVYCEIPEDAGYTIRQKLTSPVSPEQLQSDIPKLAKHCHVCAKGAIVLARIHLFNKFKKVPMSEISTTSQKIWGEANADLIESAFETTYGDKYSGDHFMGQADPGDHFMGQADPGVQMTKSDRGWLRAKNFGGRYKTPKLRLAAIMRNVIENNGKFRP
jgi:hypothetical protein